MGSPPPRCYGAGVKRLLVSIHDVSPRFEREVDLLLGHLQPHVGRRLAMLVVPNHWGDAPITPDFRRRLHAWADEGVEMFVHGWFHRDEAVHQGLNAVRARHMTAGEGEFLGLSYADALERMRRGKACVEDATGRAAAGFIAPAWLYGEGARRALPDAGFALAEDHGRVWRPADGAVLARGPVITWASRSRMRRWSSFAAAGLLRRVLRPAATVRIAVHPGDTRFSGLLGSIDRTLAAFGTHRPAAYRDLPG